MKLSALQRAERACQTSACASRRQRIRLLVMNCNVPRETSRLIGPHWLEAPLEHQLQSLKFLQDLLRRQDPPYFAQYTGMSDRIDALVLRLEFDQGATPAESGE